MKTFKHIVLAFTALLLVASCAIDEMWEGVDTQDEEKVLTFRPKFEDFESVTKAIGDASNVNELLVQVYEQGKTQLISSEVYEKKDWGSIAIPFYYGKKYEVYFWAYNYEKNPYTIGENGLKAGVSVAYPDGDLSYDALENLDAFYAIKEIDLSSNDNSKVNVSLTRPFAQVNLVADKAELETAKATRVEFTIDVAESFVLGGEALSSQSRTFTFKDENFFKNNEEISEGKAYLGTTYLFVPSSGSLEAKVTLFDSMGNKLKGPSTVTIPLASNQRTNLVFTGVEPAWDDDAMDVPEVSDGWIHIETPEQMAAFLLEGPVEGAKVHVCLDINMGGLPQKYHEAIAARTFTDLTLYGGALESGNPVEGGQHMISNFTAPAFLANATGLTVSDLVLDNFKVEGNGHVGTLVNTLKGSSTFTNVTVSNSSATTGNGAAGGVVGYIVRNTPTSRSESVSVSFDNCDLSGVTAAGSLTDGKFVGRLSGYDNGEVVTFSTTCSAEGGNSSSMSKYVSSNLACWLTDTERSAFNGWLGDEVYYRGKVSYGDTRVAVKWDGTTTVEPLLANATYDSGTTAGTNRFVVYSAFDLAGVRKKTDRPAAIYLRADVDMNGQGADGKFNVPSNFTQSKSESADDNVFDPFNYVTTLDGYRDASTNNSIYNLSIAQIEQERAAFILYASGTTVHKNINFRNCQTVAVHKPVATDAKAYGAILVSNVDATYTMENVHAYDCKVFALQKVGTLGARINGTSTLKNNSVNNCYVENYECDISERFDSGTKEMAGFTARVYADFYPHGEVGGMYGFIQGTSTISNCKVNTTSIYAFGQNDKKATVEGDWLVQAGIAALGYYLVPGRHVSTFIGNIRATGAITITNCKVDSASKCTNRWDTHQWRKQTGGSWLRPTYTYYKWDYIGQAYYVEFLDSKGSVTVDGTALTLGDCKDGTLYGTK